MFVLREDASPSQESGRLVDTYIGALLPCLPDFHNMAEYFKVHRERIAFDIDYTRKYVNHDSAVLEIGAFPYLLTLPLIDQSYNVTVLDKTDSSENASSIASRWNVKVINCDVDVENIPVADNSFDCVIMNEVFEHLRINLIRSMREILRVIRPGGLLLLSTPNLRSIRGLYNLLRKQEAFCVMGGIYDNYASLEAKGVMGHVREYTSKEVTDFLAKVGFEIDGVIYRGQYPSDWWVWRLAKYLTLVKPAYKPYFSVVARKAKSRQL